MGAAAGAAVRSRPGDNADLTGKGLLAAVVQSLQLVWRRKGDVDGMVLPDVPVGQPLHLQHVLRRQPGVEIDGHQIVSDVKAHIVTVEFSAQDAADDVLAAVLLHEVKPPLPVNAPLYRLSHRERPVAEMQHLAVPLPDVLHRRAAQYPPIRRLAAPLRIEGRAVQYYSPAILLLLAGDNHPSKFG